MEKINFSNGEKISAAKVTIDNVDYEVTPAEYDGATPLNATVFNNMQENIETAINTKADADDVYEKTETYTKEETDALIPTKAHQVNVSTEVDTSYKVNILKTKNLFDKKTIVAGDVKGDNSSIRLSSRQVQYIEAGTYTISSDLPLDTYNYGFQIVETPPPRANYNSLYNTSWLNVSSYTFTTSVNGYMIISVRKSDNSSLSVSEIANHNFYLTKGSTATTDDFIPNQINVDNEKFSDTINVGAVEDNRSRVNVLYSKNLFNKNSAPVLQAYVDNSQVGTSANARTTYIPCKANTTYTIQKRNDGTQNRFVVATTTTIPANGVSIAQYTANNDASSITITTNSTAKYLVIQFYHINETIYTEQQALDSIMISESSIPLSFEPYIVPSIKVDNEEIYRKPKVLWENSSPTSSFAGQTIALNDDISNYEYYEVIFKYSKSTNLFKSTGKVKTNEPAFLDLVAFANFERRVTSISGKNITFANAKYSSAYGQDPDTENSNYLIPVEIIGY